MTHHHTRYNPPTPYRPYAFVGYYAFTHNGTLVCLAYWDIAEPTNV